MFSVSIIVFASIFAPSFWVFMALMVMATVTFKQPAPLMADVYGQNYHPRERGSRVSIVLTIFPLPVIIFSRVCGKLMDSSLQNYKWFVLIASLAAIGSGLSFSKIPGRVLHRKKAPSLFANFEIIFQDRLFAMMLLWWSFAGIANQMTKPLRTEFLVNAKHGLNASNYVETLACMAIPCALRLVSSPFWGKLFDRSRVIVIKLVINCFLMVGLWLFFCTKMKGVIYMAATLIGIAYGGGEVALCLWVTRIAPKEKFSAYASTNIGVVGLVGLISPFIGYGLSHILSLRGIGCVAALLVLISSLGFLSLLRHPRFANEIRP
jgi:hypothetical protein